VRLTSVLAKNGSHRARCAPSEQLVYTAAETIPDLERQIVLQENSLSILLGRNPGAIPRAASSRATESAAIPVGLPSELLERRSDIQESDQNLVAANARLASPRRAFSQYLAHGYGRIRSSR